MKKLLVASAILLTMAFGVSNSAKAQITTGEQLLLAAGNLVNVQVGSINVNAVDVVDVSNVLNNLTIQDIQVLSDILNNTKIDNVLNNLLRDADIITGNQVVVGVVVDVLGNVTQILVADAKFFNAPNKKPKK
ncbi:MAG: hypothetical protein ICV51_00995 [Flavisolibacter sp.]|nr:hypothetical protein [Flavisolibacter sp.]MBD0374194.1 hypothetical protein [Flavisolibacter sp.]